MGKLRGGTTIGGNLAIHTGNKDSMNVGSATKLETARTINIVGDVTGTAVAFDGTKNIAFTAVVGDNSHHHNDSTINSLDASAITTGTLSDARLPSTISSNITGSSASCTGNAATATKVHATVSGASSTDLVYGNMADNDQFRIRIGGTASNGGWAELATGDDGTEPIYVRQYTGVFTTIRRTATLLDAAGNTTFPGNVTAYSDTRVKENLETIPNAIDKINQINGYTYNRTDIKTDSAQSLHNLKNRHVGVIAQELVKVLPEAVIGGPTLDDPDALYSVAYGNITALLIEGMKEQQKSIELLQTKIDELERREVS